MILNVLVPTDGSDHAGKAVTLAADIAEKYGAQLILLHVLMRDEQPEALHKLAASEFHFRTNDQTGKSAWSSPYDKDLPHEVLAAIGERILDDAEGIARGKGVEKIHRVLEDGEPVGAILACAKQSESNLIVMGNRGLSDLKGLLVGSVSHKVSHLAECTCVTVR
jgi:nucleotide-binding universal stress UspA family protein